MEKMGWKLEEGESVVLLNGDKWVVIEEEYWKKVLECEEEGGVDWVKVCEWVELNGRLMVEV